MIRHGIASPKRIALYSHDTMGIGHVRRNLLIAQALVGSTPRASILLIAGAREACAFALPPGVDCLTLPSLCKDGDGGYEARRLGIGKEELVTLRARALTAALDAFSPDVLIVDKVPRGALCELDLALQTLRTRARTRCVLGLREVLDDPASVRQEWNRLANEDAIRAHYDAIWVYGDPVVYDPVVEYGFAADVAAKVRYTGYFDQRQRLTFSAAPLADPLHELGLPPGRLVLGLVGGGQDGADLAEAFAQAELPPATSAVLITGPFMPAEIQAKLHEQAARRRRFRVLDFVAEPTFFLDRADAVIAMAGYNTVGEILSFEKPALLVPRVRPRCEQLIRAERLRDLGLVDLLHPDDMTPQMLTRWLSCQSRPARGRHPRVRDCLDLGGLSRLPRLLKEVLGGPWCGSDDAGHAVVEMARR
jgi:predicted glycosyltransferase